mmetsp:Transcript_32010/g.83767  ORF Transcript_32010/g.83767 Transcript_32010/m.83767 type:complete len:215 (+) Transcript_32010:2106-2750(+)
MFAGMDPEPRTLVSRSRVGRPLDPPPLPPPLLPDWPVASAGPRRPSRMGARNESVVRPAIAAGTPAIACVKKPNSLIGGSSSALICAFSTMFDAVPTSEVRPPSMAEKDRGMRTVVSLKPDLAHHASHTGMSIATMGVELRKEEKKNVGNASRATALTSLVAPLRQGVIMSSTALVSSRQRAKTSRVAAARMAGCEKPRHASSDEMIVHPGSTC